MLSPRLRIIASSILGAFAIHATFVACSAGTGGGNAATTAGGGTAHADTADPACAQWRVESFMPASFQWAHIDMPDSTGALTEYSFPTGSPLDLPEGWQPFAADSFGPIQARRCIKPAP
jgi:hypothetical protein